MTTILVLNAVSSLVGALGIGGWQVRKRRQARREAVVQPIYVTTRTPRPSSPG